MAIANGPGAESQNAIGIGVLGGMISAMVFSVFFVPALYIIARRMAGSGGRRRDAREEARPDHPGDSDNLT